MEEDWDRDEGRAMLKRRKSMDFAQNQLAALEAKYNGANNLEPEKPEKTLLQLIDNFSSADALFTCHSKNCTLAMFNEVLSGSVSAVNIVIVHFNSGSDFPKKDDLPYEQESGESLKGDSVCKINKLFSTEAAALIPQLKRFLGSGKISCFSGYSLGAGVATVMAWCWPESTDLITFGCPKVGDRDFSYETVDNIRNCMRYVYGDDPVPLHLPIAAQPGLFALICGPRPQAEQNYRHVGPELHIWIDELGHHREIVKKRTSDDKPPYDDVLDDHDLENYLRVFESGMIIDHK
eukprot:c995_g1_i2.p1 GENE.c995_g1_i2~~c995_g1_i2.p1  ORF type:complete len:292 (+),score=51.77 c995_g1_i2:70-945(+)